MGWPSTKPRSWGTPAEPYSQWASGRLSTKPRSAPELDPSSCNSPYIGWIQRLPWRRFLLLRSLVALAASLAPATIPMAAPAQQAIANGRGAKAAGGSQDDFSLLLHLQLKLPLSLMAMTRMLQLLLLLLNNGFRLHAHASLATAFETDDTRTATLDFELLPTNLFRSLTGTIHLSLSLSLYPIQITSSVRRNV